MNVILFGATGLTGSFVLRELLEAGYNVTAVARNPSKIGLTHNNLQIKQGNVLVFDFVQNIIAGYEAVISTISEGPQIVQHTQSKGNQNLISAMEKTGIQRFICMGAEGILDAPDGKLIRDHPDYPALYLPLSYEHSLVNQYLQASSLEWTQVCPPLILPQPSNGKYAVKADIPPNAQGGVNGGNIGAFIARELKENSFIRKRVGIANL